jgi:polyferredoxin
MFCFQGCNTHSQQSMPGAVWLVLTFLAACLSTSWAVAVERWGGWFLWALFAAILVWEEVWDLPQNAALSSCLLLLITGGAMVGSYFYERRVWCR